MEKLTKHQQIYGMYLCHVVTQIYFFNPPQCILKKEIEIFSFVIQYFVTRHLG